MKIDELIEILVIEDDPDDLELTLHALETYKVSNRVHVVRDGEEALDYLFARGAYAKRNISDTPRVILLDLKLPKVSGMEVLRKIKADPRLQSVPVVMMTSSKEDRDVKESYELGVNSYVVKPVDFGQFSEAMRALGMYWLLLNQRPQL